VTSDSNSSRWTHALDQVSKDLEHLNSSTESDFLSIGDRLNGFSTQAKEIISMAGQAAGLIRSEEMERNTDALQGLLRRMDGHLAHSGQGMDRSLGMLKKILDDLGNMNRPFAGFKAIVKRLKVLGVSTRIESARLTAGDNGFNTLASDVEKLSELIAAKSGQIMGRLSSLEEMIDEMLRQMSTQEELGQGSAKSVLDGIVSSLGSLRGKHDSSSTAMNFIKEQSEQTARDVSEIVASLQFHDITRQQIEHVKEAADEWYGKLIGIAQSNGSGSDLAVLSDVCDLEIRQLGNSRNELSSAIKGIRGHLDRIGDRITVTSDEAAALMRLADGGSDTFFSELRRNVSSILLSLREDTQAAENVSEGIGMVAATVKTLTDFVDEIEEIGTEIELIALNARIKAAHTGVEGAALGVLAEEIKNLSKHGREQTILITDSLHETGSLAVALDSATKEMKESTVREIEDMAKEVGLLLESFGKANEQIVPFLTGIKEESNRLRRAIQELTGGITVDGKADRTLDSVEGLLRSVGREVREQFPGARSKEQAEYLKALENRYTMHRERDVHRGISGAHQGTDLGDNVELF
jgi:methyl-accepting chemotaxis protein